MLICRIIWHVYSVCVANTNIN